MTRDGKLENRWIDIRYTKWPSQPHYAYRMRVLGEDRYGVWGSCGTGEEVYKGGKLAFVRDVALLSLVQRVGCWSALWYPPQEAQFELYVDINTNPVWGSTAVSMIDLDFDVVRKRTGETALVDEDEFEENRLRFGYPDGVVELARAASRELTTAVATPIEPFKTHWRSWYERCFEELLSDRRHCPNVPGGAGSSRCPRTSFPSGAISGVQSCARSGNRASRP